MAPVALLAAIRQHPNRQAKALPQFGAILLRMWDGSPPVALLRNELRHPVAEPPRPRRVRLHLDL